MTRNLVFSSVGDRTVHRTWISGTSRDFDLILYYYGSTDRDFTSDAEVVVQREGTKTQNFAHLYRNEPSIIESYDNFFIVDDDIVMDTCMINSMFNLFIDHDLWLAQPAYAPGSHIRWPTTSQDLSALLRYTNFVEVGVPILTRKSVGKLIGVIELSPSGWGLDMLFSQMLGDPQDRIAILDATPCLHPHRQVGEMDKVMSRKEMKDEGLDLLRRFRNGVFIDPMVYQRIPL